MGNYLELFDKRFDPKHMAGRTNLLAQMHHALRAVLDRLDSDQTRDSSETVINIQAKDLKGLGDSNRLRSGERIERLEQTLWRCTRCGVEEAVPEDGGAPGPGWRGTIDGAWVQHGCEPVAGHTPWSQALKITGVVVTP